jgi:diaminohydroxyphosphoribosylaminopyrimidine deaminase / 5-amino-6-(5-phosphoribosylamino)uracil reductase
MKENTLMEKLRPCFGSLALPFVALCRCSESERTKGSLDKYQAITPSEAAVAEAMKAALACARLWEGATAPNPPVGCTLLDAHGRIITTAAHHGAGQLHAEALAIRHAREAGQADQIHTVVVTLEPCNHHGRTPPCTDAILSTAAKNVVIGMPDPNPLVQGGGADRLRAAGLGVSYFNGDRSQLERLIAPFKKHKLQGLPWVTVKQAINRDGNMLPPVGQKTFTSQGSLLVAHALRRRADAIFTGSGTVLADDPQFTVRLLNDHASKRRTLVLFDRRNRIPASYVTAAEQRGFNVVKSDDLETALRDIAKSGGLEVLVEAGPELTAHVLQSPFWDEHATITQTNAEDVIKVTTNGGAHVLRHH